MSVIAKVFQNGRSQAIRIPKEFRVDTDEVSINKIGDTLIIKQNLENKWELFFDALDGVDTEGFLEDIEQLPIQNREMF